MLLKDIGVLILNNYAKGEIDEMNRFISTEQCWNIAIKEFGQHEDEETKKDADYIWKVRPHEQLGFTYFQEAMNHTPSADVIPRETIDKMLKEINGVALAIGDVNLVLEIIHKYTDK